MSFSPESAQKALAIDVAPRVIITGVASVVVLTGIAFALTGANDNFPDPGDDDDLWENLKRLYNSIKPKS